MTRNGSKLARVLGADRVDAELAAADRLVALCACLPLAVRIGAANLLATPTRALAAHADDLAGTHTRLRRLAVDGDAGSTVLSAFELSYVDLRDGDRRLFRAVSLAPGTDLTVADAAALLDAEQAGVAAALRRLVAAHLLDERTPGRYTFHDLLRLFAAGRSAADDPPAWRDAAVVGGTHRTAWLLADALRGHLHLSRYTTDWLTTARAALRSARGAGDLAGQAAAHHSLGTAYRSVTDHHAALEQYRAGCGWPAGPGGARPRRPRWATSASSTRSWAASTRRSDS